MSGIQKETGMECLRSWHHCRIWKKKSAQWFLPFFVMIWKCWVILTVLPSIHHCNSISKVSEPWIGKLCHKYSLLWFVRALWHWSDVLHMTLFNLQSCWLARDNSPIIVTDFVSDDTWATEFSAWHLYEPESSTCGDSITKFSPLNMEFTLLSLYHFISRSGFPRSEKDAHRKRSQLDSKTSWNYIWWQIIVSSHL